jgi:hypothetical protein
MLAEIDGFTVGDLYDRYSIDRSSLYKRINGLKKLGYELTSAIESGKAVYSLAQVEILDSLHDYLKTSGSKIANFPRIDTRVDSLVRLSHETRDTPDEAIALSQLLTLVQALAQSLAQPKPLANLEVLEKALAHEWHLSTSQLRELVGAVPSGERFSRYGFWFRKAGKNGRESAWIIGKG